VALPKTRELDYVLAPAGEYANRLTLTSWYRVQSSPQQLPSDEFLMSATGGGSSRLIFPTSTKSSENSRCIGADPGGKPEIVFDETDEPVAIVTYGGIKRRLAAEARRLDEDILQHT